MASPRTLEEIERLPDPVERARAVGKYLARIEQRAVDARRVRREAIAEVLAGNPDRGKRPTALANEIGVSVSLVKNVRDGRSG